MKQLHSRFLVVFGVVAFFHLVIFALYYFYLNPRHGKANNVSTSYLSSKKDNTSNHSPLTNSRVRTAGTLNKPKLYSWIDNDGIKHFSNRTPPPEAADIKIADAIMSDEIDPIERTAQKLNSYFNLSGKTKVLIAGNQVLVPIKFGYKETEAQTMLLLDTGASRTMIYREALRRLNIRENKRTKLVVADGRTVPAGIATLDYIVAGQNKIKNFHVAVIDYEGKKKDYAGLLGMDFLRNIQYRINFNDATITWNP